tara:strand:+ start:169 stop:396 length:228 start_codon:yes stop_codon:yes gene_type:complete
MIPRVASQDIAKVLILKLVAPVKRFAHKNTYNEFAEINSATGREGIPRDPTESKNRSTRAQRQSADENETTTALT